MKLVPTQSFRWRIAQAKPYQIYTMGIAMLSTLLTIGFFFLYDTGSSVSVKPAEGYVVVLTDNGFEPKELTIPRGESVAFKTRTGEAFWPASNFHPAHAIYSAFDARLPVAPERSWNFTFGKIGIWGYHDHLAPRHKGTIVVLDPEAGIRTKGDLQISCEGTRGKDQRECWASRIIALGKTKGMPAAFELIGEIYQAEPDFDKECHGITHYLGEAAYEAYAAGAAIAPDSRFTYCNFGFYHGFIESLLVTEGLSSALALCDYLEGQLPSPMSIMDSCVHGIGHGVTDLAPMSAWGDSLALTQPGLALCRTVRRSEHELENCAGGVFNSLSLMYAQPEYALTLDSKDPLRDCRVYEEPLLRQACYRNFQVLLFRSGGQHIKAAGEYLASIPEDAIAAIAMDNITIYASKWSANPADDAGVIGECRSLPKRLRISCITGLGAGFISFSEPEKEYERAVPFCGHVLLSEEEKQACFHRILFVSSRQYSPEVHALVCGLVEKQYRYFCPGGPTSFP